LSTKIHAVVDGPSNLARFRLTVGERHDITEASNLIDDMENAGTVVADKPFDAASLLGSIEAMNATAVTLPKANRKVVRSYDRHVYKNRNLIERFFAHLKQFRRIETKPRKTLSRKIQPSVAVSLWRSGSEKVKIMFFRDKANTKSLRIAPVFGVLLLQPDYNGLALRRESCTSTMLTFGSMVHDL
jgi:transposase